MTATDLLSSKHIKYVASILDGSLRQVGERLNERFLSVEYELFPFDSDRVVLTFGAEKVREDRINGLEVPIADSRYYSLSLGDLKVNDDKLEGEVECRTWSGPLVVNPSPTESYMADVKLVFSDKFSVRLSFDRAEDIGQISSIIYRAAEECVSKVRETIKEGERSPANFSKLNESSYHALFNARNKQNTQ